MAMIKPILPSVVGIALARLVVPVWVLTGALFKTFHATPKNLPPTMLDPAHRLGIDLFLLLWLLVAIELIAVGIMFFVPRLARVTAIFMSSVFCIVLIMELASGNVTSCGCLGDIKMPPWAMLIIDGVMLLGLVLAAPARRAPDTRTHRTAPRLALAGGWSLAWVIASAVFIGNASGFFEGSPDDDPSPKPEPGQAQSKTPVSSGPGSKPLPPYYVADCGSWEGKRWKDLEIAQLMPEWPDDIDSGEQYVIFFSKSCDHCIELFDLHFAVPPPARTTIVAIPETKAGFEPDSHLAYYCTDCAELDLPTGCDWIITTPIVVALEDGVVRCASEGEDPMEPACLRWHGQ